MGSNCFEHFQFGSVRNGFVPIEGQSISLVLLQEENIVDNSFDRLLHNKSFRSTECI